MATLPLIASDPRHQNIREYSLCSDRWFQVEILQTFCMSLSWLIFVCDEFHAWGVYFVICSFDLYPYVLFQVRYIPSDCEDERTRMCLRFLFVLLIYLGYVRVLLDRKLRPLLITAQSMMGWNKDIYLRPGSHWRLKGLSLKSRHYTFLKHQQDLVASSAAERTRTCFFLIEP